MIAALSARAPLETAESWDNVGLLSGDPRARVRGAVVSVDLTPEALALARARGRELIVIHHPCIFPKSRGWSRIVAGPAQSLPSLVLEAVRSGVAIAAYHTNFDRCALEVVEQVSRALGVRPRGRLFEPGGRELAKLVAFVPRTHLELVRRAVCEAGAGQVGDYDSCTFASQGEGTFRGNDSTRPFLGRPGKLERAAEARLETVFPVGFTKPVLEALLRSHPYEEVAYDVLPLEQRPSARGLVRGLGYGFWGEFAAPRPFSELARDVKTLFKIEGFWLTGSPPARVGRIGFAAGKGASFVESAAASGCDLFITGETGYHSALDGMRRGMAVMELGHRQSERFFVTTLERWLRQSGLAASGLHQTTQKLWLSGRR